MVSNFLNKNLFKMDVLLGVTSEIERNRNRKRLTISAHACR